MIEAVRERKGENIDLFECHTSVQYTLISCVGEIIQCQSQTIGRYPNSTQTQIMFSSSFGLEFFFSCRTNRLSI